MQLVRPLVQFALVASFAGAHVRVQQPSPPRFKIVETLRIDAATRDISSIGSVVMAPGGRMVFAEPQDFRLRFYDSTAKEIARFGRKGSGPGEFGKTGAMGRNESDVMLGVLGDTVWTFDRTLRRFTMVSKDGKLVRTVPQPDKLPSNSGGTQPEPGTQTTLLGFEARAILGDGSTIGRVSWGHIELIKRTDGSDVRMVRGRDYGYAIASPRGDIARVLSHIPVLPNFVDVSRKGGLQSIGMAVPFVEGFYESVAQDGSRVAFGSTTIAPDGTSGTLRIVVIAARGDTLLARDIPFSTTPVSKKTADSAVAERMRGYRPQPNAKTPPSIAPDMADELEAKLRAAMPKAASPYRSLTIGADYSLWLAYPAGAGGREFLVLDEKGNALGIVALPKKSAYIASVSRTTFWVREYDENDLTSLVRYTISR